MSFAGAAGASCLGVYAPIMRRRSGCIALVLVVTATLLVSVQPYSASAAPSIGNGDCWRANSPLWCWQEYLNLPGVPLHVLVTDGISSFNSSWHGFLSTGMSTWNHAAGPQALSYNHTQNEVSVKYLNSQTGSNGLGSNDEAITWACFGNGSCSDSLGAVGAVDHTNIFVNDLVLPGETGAMLTHVFMHEMGHALGLAHSLNPADLMFQNDNSVTYVGTYDIGVNPPCSQTPPYTSNEQAGTRCI